MSVDPLPLTGERTVPGVELERYWFLRHEVVYRWIAQLLSVGPSTAAVARPAGAHDTDAPHAGAHDNDAPHAGDLSGVRLLDAGCGEGYGADLCASLGAEVTALDYDEGAIAHVARAYPRVEAVRANLAALPAADAAYDAVMSLQVIEHLWNLGEFLSECRRVLRPGGTLVISTPNRPIFSPGLARGEKPVNPFHVEEFDAEQVAAMLTHAGFSEVTVHGLHHAGRVLEWEERHGPIVAAHIDAVTNGSWAPELLEALPELTVADFTIGTPEGAHDLIGVARA